MSTTESVRAACDAAYPRDRPCPYPECECISDPRVQVLISAAEKRGAEKEREACAAIATGRADYARKQVKRLGAHSMKSEPWQDSADAFDDVATAIRARATTGEE